MGKVDLLEDAAETDPTGAVDTFLGVDVAYLSGDCRAHLPTAPFAKLCACRHTTTLAVSTLILSVEGGLGGLKE
jgi:hypothetical protein